MENISCHYLNRIAHELEELKKNHDRHSNADLLIAYRGEPRCYGETQLMPSLFRNNDHVLKEMHLFELFCDYKMIESNASNIEKAIEAQHYASISRMLDISFSALVALYFACSNGDEDGYIFVFAFPEHYSPHSKYVEDFYTDMLEGKHIAYSRNFKVFSHSYSNERIKAQKGGFIFFPGMDYYPINDCYYRKIEVKGQDKGKILEDLDVLFQVNEASIFPEKEKIAKTIKVKFSNNTYSNRFVSVDDEISTYLNRISYELKLGTNYGKSTTNKDILRMLRKEEADIVKYIQEINTEDSLKKIIAIKRNFQILSMKFREA